MKRTGKCILALLIGCCAPLLILLGAGNALYYRRRQVRLVQEGALTCSIDNDCPPGFTCVGGRCAPAH